MAMSLAALSGRAPTASLSFLAGRGGFGRCSVALPRAPTTFPPLLLRSSSLSLLSPSLSFSSSFSGLSLGIALQCNRFVQKRYRLLQVRAGRKYQLCQTKRSRSRKSLARVHGFRRRMRTTSGRAVLKRRRAKGRAVLCPKTNPRSGKFS